MAIFLQEPRYQFGCLGFYTEPSWGRRVLLVGAVTSGIGFLAALAGGLLPTLGGKPAESIFLIASAWILVFGVMRLFWSGAMWILSHVFDWISDGVPSLASPMHILRRAYWVVGEVFLSVAFIGLLFTSILVGIGRLSMDEDKQAEQAMVGNPAGWSAPVVD